MKLSRREFLKALGVAAGGAALARVVGVGEQGTSTASYLPVVKDRSTPSHELLSDAHPDMAMTNTTEFTWTAITIDGQECYIPTWIPVWHGIYRPVVGDTKCPTA